MYEVSVNINTRGLDKWAQINWARVHGLIGAYWIRETHENWRSHGVSRGHPWTALHPGTLAQKRRQGYSGEPLIRTGRLRASMRVLRSDAGGLLFGTDVPYAAAHDQGRGVPERALLRVKDYDVKAMADLVRDAILEDSK